MRFIALRFYIERLPMMVTFLMSAAVNLVFALHVYVTETCVNVQIKFKLLYFHISRLKGTKKKLR